MWRRWKRRCLLSAVLWATRLVVEVVVVMVLVVEVLVVEVLVVEVVVVSVKVFDQMYCQHTIL